MSSLHTSLSDPFEERMAWAQGLYEEGGRAFLREKRLASLLEDLRGHIAASWREMKKTGIAETCWECDLEEGGSCCGAGLENRYDGWLILINLLMGVRLPGRRLYEGSCFFLGEGGCTLMARHVICINYLCKRITDRIKPHALTGLRECEGREIHTLFVIHEEIKRVLKEWTGT